MTITGASADAITLEPIDPIILSITSNDVLSDGARYNVRPTKHGDPAMVARFSHDPNIILGYQPVDEFKLDLLINNGPQIMEIFPDDSMLLRSCTSITPYIPDLDIEYRCHTAGVTMADSTRSLTRSTSDFDQDNGVGTDTFYLIWQGALGSHPCHSMHAFQNNVQISK